MKRSAILDALVETICDLDEYIDRNRLHLTQGEFDMLCDAHNLLVDFNICMDKELKDKEEFL